MQYKHIGPRYGSAYRQFFVNGRRVRAETLYLQTVGDDGRSVDEVATDFRVPVEAVREAIHYCEHNQELLRQEWQEEEAALRAGSRPRPAPSANGQTNP